MKTESKYREGLLDLLKTTKLEDINVSMLCEKVGSNRQTFYYHFRDISDVVESIFLRFKIYKESIKDIDLCHKKLIELINKNYDFFFKISESYANEKLNNFLYTYYYQKLKEIISENKKNENYAPLLSRYCSTLFAKELNFWILTKRRERTHSLMKRFEIIWKYFTSQYVSESKKGFLIR